MSSVIRSSSSLQLFAACLLALATIACGGGDSSPAPTAPSVNVPFTQIDLAVGTGAEAVAGRRVTVHYTGWIYDPSAPENKGFRFDSSVGRDPYSLTLGTGTVIPGWDRGLVGMRVGGRRQLIIPPDLAYGSRGMGSIPPNATLIFDVELAGVS